MKKIVITDYVVNPDIETATLGEEYEVICLNKGDESLFGEAVADADALLVWGARVSARTIDRLKKCKIIQRYGVGFDNIDHTYASTKGIITCNTPDYGVHEVADTACAMILTLTRKILEYDRFSKKGPHAWSQNSLPDIRRLNEHRLGIIGAGRIGSAVALRMSAFGMQIGCYDPFISPGYEKILNMVRYDSLSDLISSSTIISIHCPLSDETLGMIDEKILSRLNHGSILINTARGKVIASLDSIAVALENGTLAGVGFDVLPQEPPNFSDKLLRMWTNESSAYHDRIIITPHSAYYSKQSWEEMRKKLRQTSKEHWKADRRAIGLLSQFA